VRFYNVSPSIAYKVTSLLSVGAGLDWQRFTAELTNAAGPLGFADLSAADSASGPQRRRGFTVADRSTAWPYLSLSGRRWKVKWRPGRELGNTRKVYKLRRF